MIDRNELNKRFQEAFNLLKSKGLVHTQKDLADAIGKSETDVSSGLKGRGKLPSLKMLLRVADAFPDVISREYMETGEGSVGLPDSETRPHFEADVAAGFMVGLSPADDGHQRRDILSFFPPYDFTISVKGNSMEPTIHDGDLLACRFADDRYNVPFGKVCVIDTKDGAVVKVLLQGDDCALLRSLNPKFKDYTVPYDEIQRIALVVASLHNFTSK